MSMTQTLGLIGVLIFLSGVGTADPMDPLCLHKGPTVQTLSEEAVALVNRTLDIRKPGNCKCSQSQVVSPEDISFPRVKDFKLNVKDCSILRPIPLCSIAKQKTLMATSSEVAWKVPPVCPNGYDLPDTEILRRNSQKLKYAATKFYEITQDTNMQIRCCGKNTTCQKNWSATKLKLLMGRLGSANREASYTYPDVEIGLSRITNCQSEDCIDGALFHELGHACHRQQRGPGNPSASETFQDMKYYLGKDGTDCVKGGLNSYYGRIKSNKKKLIDFDEWADEAYADAIFADFWGPAKLGWNCRGRENADHCDPKAYLSCFFEIPGFRNRFCQ
jgi:hypothetical protein